MTWIAFNSNNDLQRVRGVEGVSWAVLLASGFSVWRVLVVEPGIVFQG